MLIAEKDRQVIREMFEGLGGPVRLVVFTEGSVKLPGRGDCLYCEQTVALVKELAELSDRVTAEIVNFDVETEKAAEYGIARIPAIAVVGEEDYGVRYYGIPSGFEFSAFLEDIIDVSHGRAELSAKSLERLARIDAPVHIQVFVTPTCPYCPPAVRLAHKMAIANEHIAADMVEAQEFPELAREYGVYGVPKTVIRALLHSGGNGAAGGEGAASQRQVEFDGAMPEEYAVLHVLQAAGKLTEAEEKELEAIAR